MRPISEVPLVTVQIVTWNSLTHLPSCLAAIMQQRGPARQLMIVDNASVDNTVHWLEEHFPHLNLLRNTRNLGFCRAHNQALRLSKSPYVLILNPDVILQPDWLERGINYLEGHPPAGSFGGKLLRYHYSADELKEVVPSGIIDSTGLHCFRNRQVSDRGSGQADRGQYDQAGEVFGISGACLLLRRSALESIRWHDEYLDEDFFAYKDDVDLAWRLQRLGWSSWYDPQAVAYHYRTVRGLDTIRNVALSKNYRSRHQMISFYSYRNHWLLLAKHERRSTWWLDGPWISWYELRKFAFLLLTQPRTLQAIGSVIRLWPRIRRKARLLEHHARRSPLAIRSWFVMS
ncbi:MAG: glycosyltransferase family 2 protein [Candidatus Kerfeldbacteria bacterium]|nr:glycosyltransferase family 2 protein [Candidatus Kerfeldbacteria bacterium]